MLKANEREIAARALAMYATWHHGEQIVGISTPLAEAQARVLRGDDDDAIETSPIVGSARLALRKGSH